MWRVNTAVLSFGMLLTLICMSLTIGKSNPSSSVEIYSGQTDAVFNHGKHVVLAHCTSCHIQGDDNRPNYLSFTPCYTCHELTVADSTFSTVKEELAEICQRIDEQNRED